MDWMPELIPNWIDGEQFPAASGKEFDNLNPATGERICGVAFSENRDVSRAVEAAKEAQPEWAALTPVARGDLLREVALKIRERSEHFARIVSLETGKSFCDALGETGAAVEMGMFVAGEGRRSYGRTTTSAVPNRAAMVVRQPLGVAGLIIAANTPIANVAWKVFPALLCGNAVVLKGSEDTPVTAWAVGEVFHEAGIPPGVLNIVQGLGPEAGQPLVENHDVDIVSFTGSAGVGRLIQRIAGERLAKVCMELGGKNPLVVCDDADLDVAADTTILSAFSNAGQRCASGSRIIVFNAIYDKFRDMLIDRTGKLKMGPSDTDDFGPVINAKQLASMVEAVEGARESGATILTGGKRLTDDEHKDGFYMAPTIIEDARPSDA
ncbi:MAG: aldehyde dehydrogenase family protein, partial [Acidobacteriota bacterium]|nr:aldehyde dehydrogenase family protein [Acidobacteriota bacterium]